MPDATPAIQQYQCRHIFTDGRRCSSPCLRQQEFCYYHHTTRKPVANPRQRRSHRSTIQSSIGQVLQRIASNDIDPRRAGLLLYGLQIASLNLPKPQPSTKAAAEPQTVEEITIDPALGILAPRTEVARAGERKSTVRLLLEKMMESEKQEKEQKEKQKNDQKKEHEDNHEDNQKTEKEAPTPPEPATIPTLQATAACPAPTTEPVGRIASRASTWVVAKPYLRQCAPPAFPTTLPPKLLCTPDSQML
ncbi:MAG: hypothetical protein ABI209_09250 [Edaphobacter sp.]